ncbi:SDR family NAD(P)-dependent oxidoreductase [Chelatococcus reniformis]|uniref:Oxidoreductase n=1 Tax=Chelatococcus reniformis TaxID=1494448 RepID=A0A916UKJ4_9HYPH|nr:SDR family NAD(P)-dependent oxidoreductase [Chelatococcus reniformis]GGC75408.1 oxidoreductase [Chelatococcus reniformis]
MQSVVVTGASSGIGWACVEVLTASGFRVFGSVRKAEDADRLSREFGASFTPLVFDVTDETAVAAGAALVDAALGGETLAGLVNNAGIAVPGPLIYLAIDDFKQQLAVNVTGQLIVTQHFVPLLGSDRARRGAPGRIVMISSVSGKSAAPFVGAYSASKFAIEGLSEALRRELMLFGIDVVIIGPGAVATPIWDKADTAADVGTFDGTPYAAAIAKMRGYMIAQGRNGLPPERIGEAVKTALTAAKPRTRYALSPTPLQHWLVSALPRRLADTFFARRLGLAGQAQPVPSDEHG